MLDDNITYNLHVKRESLAAEVPASTPERRSWIRVYAYKEPRFGPKPPDAPWHYRVRWVEVDLCMLELRQYNLDGDEAFIITRGDVRLDTVEQLESVLNDWMHGNIVLTYPTKCDCPF